MVGRVGDACHLTGQVIGHRGRQIGVRIDADSRHRVDQTIDNMPSCVVPGDARETINVRGGGRPIEQVEGRQGVTFGLPLTGLGQTGAPALVGANGCCAAAGRPAIVKVVVTCPFDWPSG